MFKKFMFIFLFLINFSSYSQTENKESPKIDYKEEFSETTHQININGKTLSYKAIAGNLLLRDEKTNAPKASLFFISYTKDGVDDKQKRPITFCFNGGPGSSSVWLHLGVFGPKRVKLTELGDPLPPYSLIENEYSILDLTDLVFIDPISTGYSFAIPPEDEKKFLGVEEDIKSVGEFIRLFITKYKRWDSPKFIAGESYGTTRAAGLAGYLHDKEYLYVNGVILISSVLNFQSILCNPGNDLPYLMFLPSFTATAWYHKKLPEDLQKDFTKAINESTQFVIDEYSVALFKGDLIKKEEKEKVINKLSRLTGLTPDYILKSNLRVDVAHFTKELLRNQDKTIGRFDSRFTGIEANLIGEVVENDPSTDNIFGAFTATLNNYLETDLKWEKERPYKILSNANEKWDYSVATNQYLNVGCILRRVITRNPLIHVFVANGYYDLALPFFGTEYTFHHLGLEPSLLSHITMEYYDAGHMMYIYKPALIKLKNDLANYYLNTLKQQQE